MKREPTVFSWNDPLEGLPLVEATSPRWIEVALSHLDRLLVDHAWCEFKAASAGLGMIARFPDERALIRPMIALAKEEMLHFRQVFDLLEERKVPLGVPPQDPYVRELRHLLCARGKGLGGLGDHLLVNAFVEARSCERFRLLATALSVEEGQDTAGIDFGYRADVTAAVPYHTPASHLGVEGATLTEAFYAESRPTAYAILDATSPRAEALKLYFLRSLVFLGSLVDGSLSFRSHWERFAAGKPATLTASIEAAYAANREGIHAVAEAALAEWEHGDLSQDPVVAAWVPLQRRFQDRIAALYDAGRLGAVVPSEPRTYLEHGRLSMGGAERETPFLSVLFGDDDAFDRFCGRRGLVLTRMNVNLLYLLLPQLGFSVVDRFAFGHFAYRAVEDLYDVDLADRLRGVMARGA